MSAFFIAVNRDRRPFDTAVAEAMMAQLDLFGHDVKQLIISDHYAIGFQSNWTVPEELGERQPLQGGQHQWFAFYGRIDNRDELLGRLAKRALATGLDHKVSDAALAQQYLAAFGKGGLVDIIGPFTLFNFDGGVDSLLLARDGMGARSVSYRVDDNLIIAASYEMALVAHPTVEYRLNDETVARHMVSQMQTGPSSMIADILVLAPGHFLAINNDQLEYRRFYAPDPKHRVTFETDEEYAIEFRRLLTQAVNRRVRCSANVGTQLSGGMDSVPVTILAANQMSAHEPEADASCLSAYSWVFDQYPEADERQFSSPLCQQLKIEQVMINCDDRWFGYEQEGSLDPLGPIYNPFMAYNHELFKQAKARSVKVMLNGIHGDTLYAYTQGVLYELIKAGEFRAALAEAKIKLKLSGSTWSFVKHSVMKPLSIVNKILTWRSRRNNAADDILQPHIVKQLLASEYREDFLAKESRNAVRPQQWQVILGASAGNDAAIGRFLEAKYAIERRYPFRDRDLCEFMLAIPSRQLELNRAKRPIVKRAFLAEFPEQMAKRNIKAYFAEVILNGLRNDSQNRTWGNTVSREWSYYVKECYFDSKGEKNHLLEVVKWRCGYYDYWKSVCYYPTVKKLGSSNNVPN